MKFNKEKIIVLGFVCLFTFILSFCIKVKKENDSNKYSRNNIYGYLEFKKYYTDDFYQIEYDNNCGPTLAINVISYYNDVKGINLFYDGKIQECYNKICEDVKYTSNNSTNLNNVASGLKKMANKRRIQGCCKKVLTKFMG